MSAFEYPHAAERTEASAYQQNAKRNRILIVEDNPISLTLLKQLLKAHGYEVLGTPEGLRSGSGDAAVEAQHLRYVRSLMAGTDSNLESIAGL